VRLPDLLRAPFTGGLFFSAKKTPACFNGVTVLSRCYYPTKVEMIIWRDESGLAMVFCGRFKMPSGN
jgi:hypothetical protein